MYKKIDPPLRMTKNEASARYPDSYIVMQMDSMKLSDDVGYVHYIGDNEKELYPLIRSLNLPFCGISEGLNLRSSFGGIIVGE